MDPSLLKFVLQIIISILMLSLGVNQSLVDLVAFWQRQGALLRSLLAVVVLFPVVVFILLKLFPMPGGVVSGLAILAAVPGAPVTYKRSALAGGDSVYTSNLHLTLALLTLIVTPLILSIFYGQFDLELEGKITVLQIARQVAVVQFLPIGIGLLLQRVGPRFLERIHKPLEQLAHLAFLAIVGIFFFPPGAMEYCAIGVAPGPTVHRRVCHGSHPYPSHRLWAGGGRSDCLPTWPTPDSSGPPWRSPPSPVTWGWPYCWRN